jgi:uncharacterized membrane protein
MKWPIDQNSQRTCLLIGIACTVLFIAYYSFSGNRFITPVLAIVGLANLVAYTIGKIQGR